MITKSRLADFYISDPHFRHRNIMKYCPDHRQFASLEEHDETLIRNWNGKVKPDDTVLCLGDVAFQPATALDEIMPRLNGRKILIKGNHDVGNIRTYLRYFDDIHAVMDLKLGDKKVLFSHYPVHTSQLAFRYIANVHGHMHQHVIERDARYINISCEHTDLSPISHEDLMKRINAAVAKG